MSWNRETILAEAQKYESRSEFKTKSAGAFKAAIRLGILDEACAHMKVLRVQWMYKVFEQ